jgi:hypothetical protein
MDPMTALRGFAAAVTIASAVMVAANWSPATTRLGFAVGALASLLWMADGMLEQKSSLVLQNIAFLIINAGGFFRWKPTL